MENRGSWMADQDAKGERKEFHRRDAGVRRDRSIYYSRTLYSAFFSASTMSEFSSRSIRFVSIDLY